MAATAPHQKDPAHVAAGKWSQALEQQALRIARKWQNGTLSDAQKGIIQAVLVPVLCPEGEPAP